MLAKTQRLNLKHNFKWVASGSSKVSPSFKIFYRLGENDQPKVGVSIATSQFKKAVDRNKAKRICFKLAQIHLGLLPNNLNLVIMPRAQILTEKFEALLTQFNNAISSLKTN